MNQIDNLSNPEESISWVDRSIIELFFSNQREKSSRSRYNWMIRQYQRKNFVLNSIENYNNTVISKNNIDSEEKQYKINGSELNSSEMNSIEKQHKIDKSTPDSEVNIDDFVEIFI